MFVVALRCLLGSGEFRADGGPEVGEPVGDRAARRGFRPSWCVVGGGELTALCGGGEVDAVVGEDAFEDVACFGDVVGVGDDEDGVVALAACERDVEAAAGGGFGGEFDAGGDGVALDAVFGGGVAEPDVLAGVVGGEGGGAVSTDR